MILFGRKDKHIGTKELPNEVCIECGKKGGVVISDKEKFKGPIGVNQSRPTPIELRILLPSLIDES